MGTHFRPRQLLERPVLLRGLREAYPQAYLMGCSTAGEIYGEQMDSDVVVVTAVCFEKTQVRFAAIDLAGYETINGAVACLTEQLPGEDLRHVFLLSEGMHINGSDLVEGLQAHLPTHISVSGGLAGDGFQFDETLVIANGPPRQNAVVAVGFYGDAIAVGCGSGGGWTTFGIERCVTKAQGNIVYELDGKPALSLYKEYLGEEYTKRLPSSALYFPLCIRSPEGEENLVRSVLRVDEKNNSLIFAGSVPEGYYGKLMKTNSARLVVGAASAAERSLKTLGKKDPQLAVLISCVGRRMVLKQLADEEIEEARGILGEGTVFSGFYSYGEISSLRCDTPYALHNQTMTITLFQEDEEKSYA